MRTVFSLAFLFVAFCTTFAQTEKNLAEKLGYDRNAKLLIVHADDMGLSQATNSAVIEAFQKVEFLQEASWFPVRGSRRLLNSQRTMRSLTLVCT